MRLSGRRALPWLLALGVALALTALWYLVQADSARPRRPVQRRAAPRSTAEMAPGFEFQGTRLKVIDPRTGQVAWELTLARAETATETGEVWLDGIEAVYHNPDATVTSLTASAGHLEPGARALVLSGKVKLFATNGGSLEAETLRWEAGRPEFRATGPPGGQVVFTRGTTVLRAQEIRGDLALKRVWAVGGVRLSRSEGFPGNQE
ncbi:MAG: LPS export ABC transporter periplasmic protein LptC [Betaproteobacteria bacterium]